MSSSVPPDLSNDSDYIAIEAAVMETERGRWFLSEYARRNRAADTASILEALTKLNEVAGPPEKEMPQGDLQETLGAIAELRDLTRKASPYNKGGPARTPPQQAAEGSIAAVRRVSEKIREVAFELRETGQNEIYATALDLYCTDLTGAADIQDRAIRQLNELASLLPTIASKLDGLVGDKPVQVGLAQNTPANAAEMEHVVPASPPSAPIADAPSLVAASDDRSATSGKMAAAPGMHDERVTPTLMFVNPL